MKCFFNLSDGSETIPDHVGVEVDSLEQARHVTEQVIEEICLHEDNVDVDWAGWKLEVVNGLGATLFSIELKCFPAQVV